MHNYTEEDIRGKVVLQWLGGLGFTAADIQLEPSFEVPIGRQRIKGEVIDPGNPGRLHPRADVLVRHVDGRNLLIIEVKAPNEPLDDNARQQGISYARLLQNGGGIAPFVILTNGKCCRIFDSMTEEELRGTSIPENHPHVKAGFRITGDILELRAVALEKLLSLNPVNLLAFCESQVVFRMRSLIGNDRLSGRKYIPELFIPRSKIQQELDELLAQGRRTILLVGPPQVGKTNLMCNTVLRRLKHGQPTLFYAAGAMGGLLEELREDFAWTFPQRADAHAHIAARLSSVVRASGHRLVVFIDAWNEATVEAARSIDAQIARMASENLTFVISLTDISAPRLLLDKQGDPSFIADSVGLSARKNVVELSQRWMSLPKGPDILQIRSYDREEVKRAYAQYAQLLRVEVPDTHHPTFDPLLLQVGMLEYQGRTLPTSLEGPAMLAKLIDAKLHRARMRHSDIGHGLLITMAEELLRHGSPIAGHRLATRWSLPLSEGLPEGLFEAALLSYRGRDNSFTSVDFYSERERDFVIAYRLCKWDQLVAASLDRLRQEFEPVLEHEVGRSALRWFLSQSENRGILKRLFEELDRHSSSSLHVIMLSAFEQTRALDIDIDIEWTTKEIRKKLRTDKFAVLEIINCMDGDSKFSNHLIEDIDLLKDLLSLDIEFPLHYQMTGGPLLSYLDRIHSEESGWTAFEQESPLSQLLAGLVTDPQCGYAAMKAWAYVAPHLFMTWLNDHLPNDELLIEPELVRHYIDSLENLAEHMYKVLYLVFNREGGLADCLKYREEFDLESHRKEYHAFQELYWPAIKCFRKQPISGVLQSYLDSLQPEEDR